LFPAKDCQIHQAEALSDKTEMDIFQINQFGYVVWELISAIYESEWNKIKANPNGNSFRQCILANFNRSKNTVQKVINNKAITISRVPSPVPPRPSASVLAKSKYHGKGKLFAQATKNNVKNIIKIKEVFPKLPTNKIMEINKIANDIPMSKRRKVNMTTKGLSRKQIIIPMNKENAEILASKADFHITNVNRLLKNTKSDIVVDFIRLNNKSITIMTNKVANPLDLKVINNYFTNVESISQDNINTA